MSEPFEVVRLVGKAPLQISQHLKDSITEDFVRCRVLFALEDEKAYLPDRSYKLTYRVRKGKASPVSVEIYVRDRWYNRLILSISYMVYMLGENSMTQIIKMEINEVEIPKDLLPHAPKTESMRVYALSRHTIGISFHPVEEWARRALWEGEAKVEETANSIIVLLPQVLSSFYNITQDNITISSSPKTNTIQIDVE